MFEIEVLGDNTDWMNFWF